MENLAALFQTMPLGVLFHDCDGRIISANPAAEKILNLSLEEMKKLERLDQGWEVSGPDGKILALEEYPTMIALRSGETITQELVGILNPEAGYRLWIKITAVPLSGEKADGDYRVYTALENVTEQIQAERQLQQLNTELEQRVHDRTTALEKLNNELDAFIYSVSHDLRSPLRRIDGFSRLLLDEYGDKLDTAGFDYINRIRYSSLRLDDLIEDLLKLSRVTRQDLSLEPIELSVLVRIYAKMLQERDPQRKADIRIKPDLYVKGDTALLRIAVENLLDNAWKFTSQKEQALIEFSSTVKEGLPLFFIRDNGAGFDSSYAEKLFKPFQRLHSEKDFPGTGVGLSIVSRIIKRHGGEIWAEGAPGKGAVFYIYLPK